MLEILGIALLALAAVAAFVGMFFLAPWLLWLCLGVVMPAFGKPEPGFWLVFCGWYALVIVAGALRGSSSGKEAT